MTAPRWRAIVDNDFAGDPDGLVSLAHVLLTDDVRVELITCTPVDPGLAHLVGVDPTSTAALGGREAHALLEVLAMDGPDIVVGAEVFGTESFGSGCGALRRRARDRRGLHEPRAMSRWRSCAAVRSRTSPRRSRSSRASATARSSRGSAAAAPDSGTALPRSTTATRMPRPRHSCSPRRSRSCRCRSRRTSGSGSPSPRSSTTSPTDPSSEPGSRTACSTCPLRHPARGDHARRQRAGGPRRPRRDVRTPASERDGPAGAAAPNGHRHRHAAAVGRLPREAATARTRVPPPGGRTMTGAGDVTRDDRAGCRDLRVEYLRAPIGIGVRVPRFSWIADHAQDAYELEVSAADGRPVWRSGTVDERGDLARPVRRRVARARTRPTAGACAAGLPESTATGPSGRHPPSRPPAGCRPTGSPRGSSRPSRTPSSSAGASSTGSAASAPTLRRRSGCARRS